MENATQAHSIAATLNLTNATHRTVCDLIRRFHTGRWPIFRRMHDIQTVGDELVELAERRDGRFAVVRWSLTEIGLSWQHYASRQAAWLAFLAARQ